MLRKYQVEDARVMRDAFVANVCYGRFSLSLEAQKRYLELKGESCTITANDDRRVTKSDGKKFYSTAITRNDKDLIKVVNEMGDAADGPEASLKVIKDCILHPGSCRIFDVYDGAEEVYEKCEQCRVPRIGENERTAELKKVGDRPRPRHNSI